MKRYISTLWVSTDPYISARIIISYYSQTRTKSPRFYDAVTIRVGNSVVQISNVPQVELVHTLRATLIACVLLPYYIDHAAHLDPNLERPLDSLRRVALSWKTKTLMRKLKKRSILSLMEGSTTSLVSVFAPLHPCRISVPYCRGSRLLAMTMLLIARILCAVHRTPQRIAKFGFVDYKQDSVLSLVRIYYQYLKVNPILSDDDKIILHASRCLTRFVNCSSDVDIESYINKLYRLFLYVYKFFRNWHLPAFGSDVSAYSGRINFILKTGIDYEKKKDYENLRDAFDLRSKTRLYQIVCLRCLRTGVRRMSCRMFHVRQFSSLSNSDTVVRHFVVI